MARQSQTPFCPDCAPNLGDAEAEASGKILRFEVPANRRAYNTDLRDFRNKLNASLKEMRAEAIAHPGSKTDILGAVALAEQEFQVDADTQKGILAVMSDLIQEDHQLDFRTDEGLSNRIIAQRFALQMANSNPVVMHHIDVYLGLLKSNEYILVPGLRRAAIMTSLTAPAPGAQTRLVILGLTLQTDGNFVVYSASNVALWSSGTAGTGAERLDMEDDGRIIIYKSAWNSGTSTGQFNWTQLAHPACDMGTGTGTTGMLGAGQCFVSPNGHFELLLQTDGNMAIYDLGVNACQSAVGHQYHCLAGRSRLRFAHALYL